MFKFINKSGTVSRAFRAKRGMTFLELVVVLGIFGAIAGTVIFNYRDFSSNVHLQNLAQDMALQIKRAQTDAVSGKIPVLSPGSNLNTYSIPSDWKPSYGIAFDISGDWQGGNAGFILYFNSAEDVDDGTILKDFFDFEGSTYTGCDGTNLLSECIDEINITSGDYIDMICMNYQENLLTGNTSNTATCSDLGADPVPEGKAYIAFTRPQSNAFITTRDNGNPTEGNIIVRVVSPGGGHKYITVWESGYISIK